MAAGELLPIESSFGGGLVIIDAWAPNALVDDFKIAYPQVYDLAIADGPPPKMFANGNADLPVVCASGLDPAKLLLLPGRCRHYVAALEDQADVFDLFETDSDNENAGYGCAALDKALRRVVQWSHGKTVDPMDLEIQRQAVRAERNRALNSALNEGGLAAYGRLTDQYAAQDRAAGDAQLKEMLALGFNPAMLG